MSTLQGTPTFNSLQRSRGAVRGAAEDEAALLRHADAAQSEDERRRQLCLKIRMRSLLQLMAALKHNFRPLRRGSVLEKVAHLPIASRLRLSSALVALSRTAD
jgi:hypothetical protein